MGCGGTGRDVSESGRALKFPDLVRDLLPEGVFRVGAPGHLLRKFRELVAGYAACASPISLFTFSASCASVKGLGRKVTSGCSARRSENSLLA